MKNQNRAELRYGSLLLSLGALTTIICILLEVNAGWASLLVEIERTNYEAGKFLFENWDEMSLIWTWALIGNVFFTIASMLLMKNSMSIGWFPSSLFWSIYFVGSFLLITAFGISLGSYLFNYCALFQLVALVFFFQEGFY